MSAMTTNAAGGPLWSSTSLERLLTRYGLGTAMALMLLYFFLAETKQSMSSMQQELHDHVRANNYLLRQVCVNSATLAQTSSALCELPSEDRYPAQTRH